MSSMSVETVLRPGPHGVAQSGILMLPSSSILVATMKRIVLVAFLIAGSVMAKAETHKNVVAIVNGNYQPTDSRLVASDASYDVYMTGPESLNTKYTCGHGHYGVHLLHHSKGAD